MNEHDYKPVLGVVTAVGGTLISWLPQINLVLQCVSLLVAITAGTLTIFHWVSEFTKKRDK